MRERVLNITENLLYIVGGIFAIKMSHLAVDYSTMERGYYAIGGEIFVSILVYGVLYLIIKNGFNYLNEKEYISSRKQFANNPCMQATAKIRKNGKVIVKNRDGSKSRYNNLAEYLSTMIR